MKLRWRLLILALLLIILALTATVWLSFLLSFVKANKDVIEPLDSLLAILLGLGGLVSGFLALKRPTNTVQPFPPPTPIVDIRSGDFVGHDQNKLNVNGGISGGTVTVGNGNVITTHNTVNLLADKPTTDPAALQQAYLSHLFETAGILQLSGVDPKAASESSANLSLAAVYTALLTQTLEQQEHFEEADVTDRAQHRLSALAQLNRYPHLVLLGDPGSGKSTFVNFITLCLAGQALGHKEANLKLLTAPLPQETNDREEPANLGSCRTAASAGRAP